jgi:hypothetical protein
MKQSDLNYWQLNIEAKLRLCVYPSPQERTEDEVMDSSTYSVVYLLGNIVDTKAKGNSAALTIGDEAFELESDSPIHLSLASVRTVDLQQLEGFGPIVRLLHTDGTIWITVPQVNIAGLFVLTNVPKTRELYSQLHRAILASRGAVAAPAGRRW